jgi:uncharacterized protein (TIGR00369 family)
VPSRIASDGSRSSPAVIPARDWAGIHELEVARGRSLQEMKPRRLTDAAGAVVPGALGILADSALGTAVMTTVPEEFAMVTTHLHLELLQAIPPGRPTIRCAGRQGWLQGRFGLGEGDLFTTDGTPIARATIGSLLIDAWPDADPDAGPPTPESRPDAAHALLMGAPVHAELRTRVLSASELAVEVTLEARSELANSGGGLHGGIGFLVGERTLELALVSAGGGSRALRPVELRAAFLRRIAADGRPIRCRASLNHLGRRLASAHGEVLDQQGRPAVVVDATYISA